MIRIFTFVTLFLFSLNAAAQKQYNNWYFGSFAGISFNQSPPVPLLNSAMDQHEGVAVYSDKNTGELLFYTDGVSVWNKNHQVMPNGTGLMGHESATQSALIVPFPGSDSLFYIFTVTLQGSPEGLRYNILDLSLDNGNGDITLKNILLSTPVTEKLTGVRHSNGMDIWVLAHDYGNTHFQSYLVTSAGISPPVISDIGTVQGTGMDQGVGFLKSSHNGSRLVSISQWFEPFDFNNSTGEITNHLIVKGTNYRHGVSFSPNDKLLFVADRLPFNIEQYDLTATDIAGSMQLVAENVPDVYSLQMAPDGKIYGANYQSSFLGVIEYPNTKGITCNYSPTGFDLRGRISKLALPNMIETDLASVSSPENPVACIDSFPTDLILSNVFTPNGDGINDLFGPNSALASEKPLLTVYDRWGVKVFESAVMGQSWDGTTTSGEPCTPGVYFWLLEMKSICSSQLIQKKGAVQLLR